MAIGFVGTSKTNIIWHPVIAPSGTTWLTSSGSLGTVLSGSSLNAQVTATNINGVTYSVAAGILPPGIALDGSSGAISGTSIIIPNDTTYNFTIRATSGVTIADRAFSITLTGNASVTWTVINGSLSVVGLTPPLPANYVILSGTLAPGTFLSGGGLLYGTMSAGSSSNTATIAATDIPNTVTTNINLAMVVT